MTVTARREGGSSLDVVAWVLAHSMFDCRLLLFQSGACCDAFHGNA